MGIDSPSSEPFVCVLGVAQDAGYPQAGCRNACCRPALQNPALRKCVASLAIVDPRQQQRWLIDCTPDFPQQLRVLDRRASFARTSPGLDGILLTHAHMGHYTGLLHLGLEALAADAVPVLAMPRMQRFLQDNAPWEQLVRCRQIILQQLTADRAVDLNSRIAVTPFLVPHRGEYSETVGFRIAGPNRSIIYLPDIDQWDRWQAKIEDVLAQVDFAYLDGTFFDDGELTGRSMSAVRHPFVTESIARFRHLPPGEREKVRFIHANHTNPILHAESGATVAVREAGHQVACQGEQLTL